MPLKNTLLAILMGKVIIYVMTWLKHPDPAYRPDSPPDTKPTLLQQHRQNAKKQHQLTITD